VESGPIGGYIEIGVILKERFKRVEVANVSRVNERITVVRMRGIQRRIAGEELMETREIVATNVNEELFGFVDRTQMKSEGTTTGRGWGGHL
jgi:hypothetical protein